MMRYTYHVNRLTAPELRGMQCDPVRRADGKCIRGRNGSMLVRDAAGEKAIKRYNFTYQELALWLKHPDGTRWERAKFSHWAAPTWAIVLCAVEALGKLEGMTILDAAKILREAETDGSKD